MCAILTLICVDVEINSKRTLSVTRIIGSIGIQIWLNEVTRIGALLYFLINEHPLTIIALLCMQIEVLAIWAALIAVGSVIDVDECVINYCTII
jgi:hypothetical protein